MDTENPWSHNQVRDFVKDVKREWGKAWRLLGPAIQEAMVMQRALLVLQGEHRAVFPAEMSALTRDMLAAAGLRASV